MEYLVIINHLPETKGTSLQNIKEIKSNITYANANGRINETQYNLLMKRVSYYENDGCADTNSHNIDN